MPVSDLRGVAVAERHRAVCGVAGEPGVLSAESFGPGKRSREGRGASGVQSRFPAGRAAVAAGVSAAGSDNCRYGFLQRPDSAVDGESLQCNQLKLRHGTQGDCKSLEDRPRSRRERRPRVHLPGRRTHQVRAARRVSAGDDADHRRQHDPRDSRQPGRAVGQHFQLFRRETVLEKADDLALSRDGAIWKAARRAGKCF